MSQKLEQVAPSNGLSNPASWTKQMLKASIYWPQGDRGSPVVPSRSHLLQAFHRRLAPEQRVWGTSAWPSCPPEARPAPPPCPPPSPASNPGVEVEFGMATTHIYRRTLTSWDPPHDLEFITDKKRDEILSRIAASLEWEGESFEFEWPPKHSRVPGRRRAESKQRGLAEAVHSYPGRARVEARLVSIRPGAGEAKCWPCPLTADATEPTIGTHPRRTAVLPEPAVNRVRLGASRQRAAVEQPVRTARPMAKWRAQMRPHNYGSGLRHPGWIAGLRTCSTRVLDDIMQQSNHLAIFTAMSHSARDP